MKKTVLPQEYVEKLEAAKTCEASDLEAFVAKAAEREISRDEAKKLFTHWRGVRVLRNHMLNSAAWVVCEDEILFDENNPGRHITAYYR